MKLPKYYINTIEGYEQFRKKLEDTLDWIEFDKIARVMKFLDWQWAMESRDTGEIEHRIPTENEIRNRARELFIECVKKSESDTWNISTGGITVRTVVYDPDEEGIDKELKKELESLPDDFEHRVDLLFRFSIEESLPMY